MKHTNFWFIPWVQGKTSDKGELRELFNIMGCFVVVVVVLFLFLSSKPSELRTDPQFALQIDTVPLWGYAKPNSQMFYNNFRNLREVIKGKTTMMMLVMYLKYAIMF